MERTCYLENVGTNKTRVGYDPIGRVSAKFQAEKFPLPLEAPEALNLQHRRTEIKPSFSDSAKCQ